MKTAKQKILSCPSCGAQYIPSEIFIPKFLVEDKEVEKDCYGKILFCEGREADLSEKYTCDICNAKFKVSAILDYKVEKEEEFDEEVSVKLNKKLTMTEE